jgi:hypothetical protein
VSLGHKSQSKTEVRLNGININQSNYGNAIPLVYGQNRAPLMLLWYGNWRAIPHTQQQPGGKGGGGGSSNTTFTYSASMIMGLCEGPINGVGQVWKDKTISSLAALGLTLFNGAGGQATWSYLTTNFPSQAVPYDHTAYVAIANMQLGSSASLPNHTFEVTGFLPFNFGTINDAEPSAILVDYCTDANHGANFNALGAIQGAGVTTYQSYCLAMGFFLSPYEATQRAAVAFIQEVLKITNSDAFMSAGVLNIVPYADSSVTGNGRTYTPNLTPLFSFTEDDLRQGSSSSGSDPIIVDRKPLAMTYNTVRVEYSNRANAYNLDIAEATDAQDIALNGVRVMLTITFHSITTAPVARQVAQLILQRQLYIRSTFTFSVRADYCLLEPMDLVAITDSVLGIVNKLVRIIEVQDDQGDNITLIAEDMLVGTASAPLYNWQAAQGFASNYGVAPPSVAAPVIFTAPPLLVSAAGGYELWIAVDEGAAGSWGGCDVYMSLDGTSYIFAGTINGAARYGTLTTNLANHTDPDTVDTLAVALTNAPSTVLQLLSGSAADYNNLRTLIYVDGEFMAYQTATLTTPGNYNLTTLRRGLYGSAAAPHLTGSPFVRIDAGIFRVPFDIGMMGQTMHFKFASFNLYGQAHQSLAAATDYTHVLANNNAGQNMPGALTLIGVGVTTASNTAFKSAQTSAWDASVYSSQSYTNGCSAACYAGQSTPAVNGIMLGLTTNPSTSNSYTNLNYALFASASGVLSIYEGGVSIGTFGTYTTSTLLNIVYDGKHVAYYAGGVLLRSVPITGLTLFMQICMGDAGDSVYGIDFTPIATAVTPYTLVPMATTVAAAGTRVISNATGANGWGTKCFQSKESYSNGVTISASVNPLGDAQLIGLSAAPATGDATGIAHFLAAWYPHGGTPDLEIIFNGANLGSFGAYVATSDVLTIAYDNFTIYWYRNNTLVLQKPFPKAGPLYLFGDFFEINEGFASVSVAPYSPSTPQAWIARGPFTVSDTSVRKDGGSAVWTDGDAYSINGFPTCHAVFKANQTNGALMVGLVSGAPPATPNFTGLNYAIYCRADGLIEIYESGVSAGTFGSYATADYFALTYDGATVLYVHNGATIRTKSAASLTMFADIAINSPGAQINSLEFGPTPAIPLADAAQLGLNAATVVAETTVNGPILVSAASGTLTIATNSIPALPIDVQISVTFTGALGLRVASTFPLVVTIQIAYASSTFQWNMNTQALYPSSVTLQGTTTVPAGNAITVTAMGVTNPGGSDWEYGQLLLHVETVKR